MCKSKAEELKHVTAGKFKMHIMSHGASMAMVASESYIHSMS